MLGPVPFAPIMPELSPLLPMARQLVRDIDALGAQLPPDTVDAVHLLLRDTTTYYSNLIEGHDTHPIFLDDARKGVIAKGSALRDKQLEALAHAKTQEVYETALENHPAMNVTAPEVILGVHRSFYSELPPSMRTVRDLAATRTLIVEPGALREYDVHVGAHVAPPFAMLPEALGVFGATYDPTRLLPESTPGMPAPEDARASALVAVAAAHHRLLWIHPFGDGNGRVARIITDLLLARLGLGARGVWSMSRGLARSADQYRQHLANADAPPWNATDGRGPLSARFLGEFCAFFLEVAADQVKYMRGVLAFEELRSRVRDYVRRRVAREIPAPGSPLSVAAHRRRAGRPTLAFRAEAAYVIEHLLTVGTLPRGEVARVANTSDRTAHRLVRELEAEGFATSLSPRGPIVPRIPTHAAPYLLQRLFPIAPSHAD